MGNRRSAAPRILVIDDDDALRSLVRLHLANAGYDVVEAEDAIEGGYLIIRASPALVICDVNMPYMSGYDFVAALKADLSTRHIPVVFLTVDDDVAEKAQKLGAVAYLRKPVRADRLLEVVALFAAPSATTAKDG